MFDGEREQPEQRVSLLLRINPRRYDPALAAVGASPARGPAAEQAAAGDTPEHSIARLLRLSRRARALARDQRGDRPPGSTARTPRCSAR